MLKSKIKYYLSKNPIGVFLVLMHWGLAYKAFTFVSAETVNGVMRESEMGLVGIFLLSLLDLPAILFSATLLIPLAVLGSSETYFSLVLFLSVFTITFQWLFIGKRVTNFFWKSEAEKKELSIYKVT